MAITRRTVLLPQVLDMQLDTLTRMREETKGILLYKPQGLDCFVDLIFLTGIGPKDHVGSHEKIDKIVDRFFKKDNAYRSIPFHVRTDVSLPQYDPRCAYSFTLSEMKYYGMRCASDKDFIGMLITPLSKSLYGLDNPELMSIPPFEYPDFYSRQRSIGSHLESIAHDLKWPVNIMYSPKTDTLRR